MENTYRVGDAVKVTASNAVGRVLLTLSESNIYTGEKIPMLEVLVAGRVISVPAWEVEAAASPQAHANVKVVLLIPEMIAALKAYQLLDDKVANCEEHDPEDAPEVCEECFPFADDARCKMRAVLVKLAVAENTCFVEGF